MPIACAVIYWHIFRSVLRTMTMILIIIICLCCCTMTMMMTVIVTVRLDYDDDDDGRPVMMTFCSVLMLENSSDGVDGVDEDDTC